MAGIKISEMQQLGYAPSDALLVIAYNNQNYAIKASYVSDAGHDYEARIRALELLTAYHNVTIGYINETIAYTTPIIYDDHNRLYNIEKELVLGEDFQALVGEDHPKSGDSLKTAIAYLKGNGGSGPGTAGVSSLGGYTGDIGIVGNQLSYGDVNLQIIEDGNAKSLKATLIKREALTASDLASILTD